ncbi:hypothetical protein N665_1356s0002 [Sinapis alba]|nr:hypothetical protein N665_1356s0002 [Sinapis alba]
MEVQTPSSSQEEATTQSAPVLKGSWVGAVQNQKVLTKYDMDITMVDGVGSVMVPDEVLRDAPPLWEDFLVGKFLDNAPHIAKIHAIVNKIWVMGDKTQMVDVYEVNSTTMKFRIGNPIIRNRITRRGMWNLAGIPVVMTKWTPFIEEQQTEKKSVPLWVHLHNVPMNMFSWKGLSFISSPVGMPAKLHPETTQCLNMKVAKVFVNADLSKEMPKTMNFTYQGKDIRIDYTYPWLPTKCSNCGKWGHAEKACLTQRIKTKENHEVVVNNNPSVETSLSLQLENGQENGKIMEVVDLETVNGKIHEKRKEGKTEKKIETETEREKEIETETGREKTFETEEEKSQEETGWSSPTKACRSPTSSSKLDFGHVSVVSNSRFSVLSTEEEGEIIEQSTEEDKEAEKTGNSENSVSVVKQQRSKEVIIPRQSLPRGSKDNHKFLSDSTAQKAKEDDSLPLNKKKPRSNH